MNLESTMEAFGASQNNNYERFDGDGMLGIGEDRQKTNLDETPAISSGRNRLRVSDTRPMLRAAMVLLILYSFLSIYL